MRNLKARPILVVTSAYWAMFWLLNALDKFFNRSDIGFMHWYGNDRREKFTMYFDRLGFSPEGVNTTLYIAGIVEAVAAALFIWALWSVAVNKLGAVRLVDQAIAASVVVFFGFAFFDVIVGDRAELLEHSTYVGILLISYLAVAIEGVFIHLRNTPDSSKTTT